LQNKLLLSQATHVQSLHVSTREAIQEQTRASIEADEQSPDDHLTDLMQVFPKPTFATSSIEANQLLQDDDPLGAEQDLTVDRLKALQQSDSFAQDMRKRVADTPLRARGWVVDDNEVLRYRGAIYVADSEALRNAILYRCHDDPLAGHFGNERTYWMIKRKFYWPKMRRHIETYISSCDVCQRVKVRRHKPYGAMGKFDSPSRPWQHLSFDMIVKLPTSIKGRESYDSILVVCDRFTRMVRYVVCREKMNAAELADLFFEQVISLFGCPSLIISDRGTLFTSDYWREFCMHLKIKRGLSTAYHPETDGLTERQNQTLEHYLRTYADEKQTNWANLLPMAEFVYNNSPHAVSGQTPLYLFAGYEANLLPEIEDDFPFEGEVPAVSERLKRMQQERDALKAHWQHALDSQEKLYNRVHKPQVFVANDLVMLSAKNVKLKTTSRKLSPKKLGPFTVVEPIGSQAYRLHLPPSWRMHDVFHVSLLEPYRKREGADIPNTTPPELVEDEPQWEVEAILGRKTQAGTVKYLVRWKGWEEQYNQWVPEQDMMADALVQDYNESERKRKRVLVDRSDSSRNVAAAATPRRRTTPAEASRTEPLRRSGRTQG